MKALKILLFLVPIMPMLMIGCASLDVSTVDTAIPLYPQKVRFQVASSSGLSLDRIYLPNEDMLQIGYFEDDDDAPYSQLINSFTFVLPYDPETDLGFRFWFDVNSTGTKLSYKKLMFQQDNTYIALNPALTYLRSQWKDHDAQFQADALGAEFQALFTYLVSQKFNTTLAFRSNYNYLNHKKTLPNQDMLDYSRNTYNFGVRGNAELKLGFLSYINELGMEAFPIGGKIKLIPIVATGIGVSF